MSLDERFWAKVRRDASCWEWTARRTPSGYGTIKVGTATRLAHRVSWELHFGAIPDGMCILHRCDNPPCVNPAHLFLGMQLDNVRDREAKGRASHGEKHGEVMRRTFARLGPAVSGEQHPRAKLRREQAEEIRRRYRRGNGCDLAKEFGVSRSLVRWIVAGHSWKAAP